MNWGKAIAIVFSVYVVLLIGAFIFSTGAPPLMVEDNYYERELAYQEQIDKSARASALSETLTFRYLAETDKGMFTVPKIASAEAIRIDALFYRPNNDRLDMRYALTPDSSYTILVDLHELIPGFWKVKIEWQAGSTQYYNESSFTK
jgi:nitrogen fixation protein FixH